MDLFPQLCVCMALLFINCDAQKDEGTSPIVKTKNGRVKGIKETSINGKSFYSYMSIPYAKPPLGKLRFKDPVPMERWEDILDGTKMPSYCLQYSLLEIANEDKSTLKPFGQEDCLYLNIHTPKVNYRGGELAVMVFIHGGGFFSGGVAEAPPYVLLNEDIVYVAIQYRLGVFGFLSTEDAEQPGNMGLKDQQLALKWVKENIVYFGGDPSNITLFGQSAGGSSVQMQMLSPGSRGLFHRAIFQSGNSLCPWATAKNHRSFAAEIGCKSGCTLLDDTQAYIACMQEVDGLSLLQMMADKLVWNFYPLYVIPRVDGDFLPDDPETLLATGNYNKVDLITGMTRDDGAFILYQMQQNPAMQQSLNTNFDVAGPASLFLTADAVSQKIAKDVYQTYLNKSPITISSEDNDAFLKLLTDLYMTRCIATSAYLHASDSEISTYLYSLDHKGQRSFEDFFTGLKKYDYIGHGEDLFYLFHGGPLFSNPLEREKDIQVRDVIVSSWINFARTGNPTPDGTQFTWEKATINNFQYLSIQPEPKMIVSDKTDIRPIWLSLKLKQSTNKSHRYSLYNQKDVTSQKEEL